MPRNTLKLRESILRETRRMSNTKANGRKYCGSRLINNNNNNNNKNIIN